MPAITQNGCAPAVTSSRGALGFIEKVNFDHVNLHPVTVEFKPY